jgi:replicative DNA helicase
MLGKRTLQHISSIEQKDWKYRTAGLRQDLEKYRGTHANCFILESCGTADAAAEAIEHLVAEKGVRYAVVDYAQLLRSEGKNRYEQITNTSIVLRQLASRTKVVLFVLCQLNRAVESRAGEFLPMMSDIRDSGQLEQDADVIVFQCWPHRLDPQQDPQRYQFFIAKNRNRMIGAPVVECRFLAERQMFSDLRPSRITLSDSAGEPGII